MQFLAALTLFAASASAYTVLTPTANSTITKGTSVDIEWSSVDTDASTFSIYLVNFVEWPPVVLSLAQNVPQADGSLDVTIPCSVDSGDGWQINFINGTNTYVIYAQSSTFTLTGNCVDPTTTSSVAAPTTVTATATVYKNSTVTATTTATLVKTVETVVFESPVVWFVQPSALAAANGAMCPPSAPQTVTVYNAGSAPVTCGAGSSPTTATSAGIYGNYTVHASSSKATASGTASSSGSVIKATGTASATSATFTGAASSIRVSGGALALFGAVAMFL